MRWLVSWVVMGTLSGCASMTAAQGGAAPRVLFASAMCGGQSQGPRMTWVDSAADLRRLMDRLHGPGQSDMVAPVPDFASRAAVLLEMGAQPSPGYGLTLQAEKWHTSDDTLSLTVNWLTPLPGRVYPQVIVHPCLLIDVPRDGYRHIEVRDQHGAVRMRGDVDATR